jgi:parallel beta-helix repeat protein
MSKKLSVQIVAFIATLLLASPILVTTVRTIPPITSDTLIVDINGNGDYTSIIDAINNAKTTDSIEIKEGVYKENSIVVNKKLTIIGESSDGTIIDFNGETGFILSSTDVDISNLKLTNAGKYAIQVITGSDACRISDCIIDKYGADTAIFIGAPYVVVSNCNISGLESTGIGINMPQSNNIVRGCTIQGFDVGIMASINAHDNEILDCNIVSNEVGIDIRINSHDNIVSECNLYSNVKGIYIWQSSNNNLIYRNNFWKNDFNAFDENNNSWDNGAQGNYWDDYRGEDIDNNGIGDTPYVVYKENEDSYPIMNLLLPDVITLPTNIKQTTSISDNKPSFTWTPSIYSKEIKGYYVKIDTNAEQFIGDKTSWTSTVNVSDGAHIFYIRAETVDETSTIYATFVFYVYSSIDVSLLDSDNDGLSDMEENQLGSDPNNLRDVTKVYPGGKPYFLVDVNDDNSFDVLYNPTTKVTSAIEKSGDKYLIDTNGDGEWNYIYDTIDGSISTYSEEEITSQTLNIWMITALILTILAVISIIVWYYIKNIRIKSKYPRYEEYKKPETKPVETPVVKKPLVKIPTTERGYTVEMMNETRSLIQRIEKDFAEYVENLRQLDEQIEETSEETKNEDIYRETKKIETNDMSDVEAKVDKLFLELSKK